ncbi:hypothetical protein [Aeromicrobium wangtongii]|uniref:Uncharacterized protein n=1 Tax=Aeromicrobium wangtongii TaxID=2969247 RepID=A0ABY5M9W2_9ACTN|nr:hypothetical protein [Aeromicrobium wangtongii]MCD9199480.1 hypothetical protein [Aeromicrobium wangtongii]UUP13833.1 hypothetical protein NQV15_00545 [Aeromicrobium wangtongii]
MKKIVIALFASVALVLGSGALVSGASAADPYPGTVPTAPSIPGIPPTPPGVIPVIPTPAPSTSTVRLKLDVGAGNARVSGKMKVTFNGKVYWFKVVNGKANIKFPAPKLKGFKKGKTKIKTIKYEFKPWTGSVFKGSKGKAKLKVKKK